MNKRYLIYIVLGLILGSMFVSCNDSDKDEEYELSSNVAVTSFSLNEDDDVLSGLDNVFFTIDLDRALIYNADSLPKGTDVSKLTVSMQATANFSASFHVKNGTWMKDTTFLYSEADSIDFTGDVRFTIVSEDLSKTREYSIKVNVHQLEPDSLYWNQLERRDIPTITGNPSAQQSVKFNEKIYCLTLDRGDYVMSVGDKPNTRDWVKNRVAFGFTPNLKSLNATAEAIYVLDTADNLYKSEDGLTWSATGVQMRSIVGGYENRLLGTVQEGSVIKYGEYSGGGLTVGKEIAADFPVSETSQLITYNYDWMLSPQGVMIGGRDQSGKCVGGVWGFDGKEWAVISPLGIGVKRAGMTLFSYVTFETDEDTWKTTKRNTLVAMGGMLSDGTLDNAVYVSLNNGITWQVAGDLMQLPSYIFPFQAAQAFVYTDTYTVGDEARAGVNSDWNAVSQRELPMWLEIAAPKANSRLRLSQPITSWDCPYVYLIGGTNSSNILYNNIWRGVINRLSFNPIY